MLIAFCRYSMNSASYMSLFVIYSLFALWFTMCLLFFQLCLDIYLVRESGDLDLEEDLFAKLVFLYRSPETMIEWTRERKEGDEGDSPEASIAQE